MINKEILAPAGSYEALQAAVYAGCDAVYLGGMRFGARAFANNFNETQLAEAIAFCHRYGVAVYVTVNTLIHQAELADLVVYLDFLYEHQVDAFIVQDYGVMNLIRMRYPDVMIHASTQMHVHNKEGAKLLEELGLTRVVLSRECSIEQIREIRDACPKLELEVFVYGAHCVSYSGQCLMSSIIGGRSGNRGECAQPCRLPYALWKESAAKKSVISDGSRYLISMKDLNTLEHVYDLIEAGVTSFKIEGRMKRPEYVAKVVSTYREAFDRYDQNKLFHPTATDEEELKKLFNRGFTPGHLFNKRGSDIVNMERPNHIGVPLGEVVYVHRKERRIGILLQAPLYQNDGIRFLGTEDEGWIINKIYRNDLLANTGNQGETIEIDWREGIQTGSKVVKTSDSKLLEQLQKAVAKPQRKQAVDMKMALAVGQPAVLTMTCQKEEVRVTSSLLCEEAKTAPLTKERLEQQLSKLQDTPFVLQTLQVFSDERSILPVSQLNQMRREAALLLEQKKMQRYQRTPRDAWKTPRSTGRAAANPVLTCSVYKEAQLQAALDLQIERIYVHDERLFEQYRHLPQCVLSSKRVKEKVEKYDAKKLLVRELGAFYQGLQQKQDLYIDDTMNVYNAETIRFFAQHNIKSIALSNELQASQIAELMQSIEADIPIEMTVYGHLETMLLKHCVINTCTIDTKQKDCNMCRIGEQYYLQDRKDASYPLLTDWDCFTHILHNKPLHLLEFIEPLKQMGINFLRLNFTIESKEETKAIMEAYRNALAGMPNSLAIAYITGYFNRGGQYAK